MTVVDARELYRFFHAGDDEAAALRGVSIQVDAGEVVALMGPSGAGKSTLLRCIAGLDDPDGGTIYVHGQPISRRPSADRARLRAAHIGVVFQTANLFDHLDVIDNVRLAQRLSRTPAVRSPAEVLERVGLAGRARARPGTLSGGEAARAALAVACANLPDVLVLDEPTGELDSLTAATVIQLLRDEARRGAAVVVATHSHEVARAAHRVVHLDDGRIVA